MATLASEEFVQLVTYRHATDDLAIDFRNKEGRRDATWCEVDGLALTIESIEVAGPRHTGLVPETEYVPFAGARPVRCHEGLLVDGTQKAKAQPCRTVTRPAGRHRRSFAQTPHDSLGFWWLSRARCGAGFWPAARGVEGGGGHGCGVGTEGDEAASGVGVADESVEVRVADGHGRTAGGSIEYGVGGYVAEGFVSVADVGDEVGDVGGVGLGGAGSR